MNYKGKELIEANGVDYPLGNTPKKMLVWDYETLFEFNVLGYYNGKWVVANSVDNHGTSSWLHAAEIPTEEETLLTCRELSKWLAQGNGEASKDAWRDEITYLNYLKENENEPVDENYRIRKWDDTEWHKPTREYAFGEEDA